MRTAWLRFLWACIFLPLWTAAAAAPADRPLTNGPNVVLWDTITPWADPAQAPDWDRWKPVPRDLLTLEADPPKARSDPGYYGRDYVFQGDAVVENRYLVAVFSSATGRIVLWSRDGAPVPALVGRGSPGLGRKVLELVRLGTGQAPAPLRNVHIVRNAGDEVALGVLSSTGDSVSGLGVFTFDRTQIVGIQPAADMSGVSLRGPIEYGIVPNCIGDDLVFSAAEYPAMDTLCLPSENWFVGLLPGEDLELVMTWPSGKQRLSLRVGSQGQATRRIDSVDFEPAGQSLYLAVLGASGIWHREMLQPSFLEKDVAIDWKRPFPARWKTQLSEEGLKTTYVFRATKGQIWRGVAGFYDYPVWFEGEVAHYHLGKKVSPKGESVVYCLEAQDTPLSAVTPVDILQATLGRPLCESILDLAGRKLRTHHRRGGDGVRRACTCGCTEVIQAIFDAGNEVNRKKEVEGAVEDMTFFVRQHVARIGEYQHFAEEVSRFLEDKARGVPELKPYLDGLKAIADQIPQECSAAKENMKSLAYADELARKTTALTSRKDPNNPKAYLDLLKAWREMGGAQDEVVARCHLIARRLCQQAGYGAVNWPQAAVLAVEIRARCRECLQNPDGYEIWPDY